MNDLKKWFEENTDRRIHKWAHYFGAGSSGLEANRWAGEARWQAFVQVMNNAGIDALVAARDHDVDALPQAGNVLYPPYEACDIEDNPGVAKP